MKKFLIIILTIVVLFNPCLISAMELPEITNDIEIRYKWYKEIVSDEGEYYLLKDINKGDRIDENNIKYGVPSTYEIEYCSLPSEYYQKEETYIREYQKVLDAAYVIIENINYDNNIKIYYDNQELNFGILSNENNIIKINLRGAYSCDKLLFFVNSNTNYKITLYRDLGFKKEIMSQNIENAKIAIPDKTWINKNTKYTTYTTQDKIEESDFVTLISETISCSYKEKYIYKYNVTKEYYDNDYHAYIEGYTKDTNDYKVFYTGEPIANTIEIITEKIVKEPKIEYVYIEQEKEIQKNDSSQEIQCSPEIITKTKTEIVEKEIFKIPIKIYIIISMLIITIIVLIIKLCKKYVV